LKFEENTALVYSLGEREKKRQSREGKNKRLTRPRRKKNMMMAYLWTFFPGLRHQFISIY